MLAPQERKFLHLLSLAGAGAYALEKCIRAFSSFETALKASPQTLEQIGLTSERARAIERVQKTLNPDDEMRKLITLGISLVSLEDEQYPNSLKTMAVPPQALYIKGSFDWSLPALAVVGTRKATAYGREALSKILSDLARQTKIAIISGLAQGIDTEAHRKALEYRLPTAGVIGGGLDRASFFPAENWNLSEEIVKRSGAVISEYPPGMRPARHHFPARNRIIAGLALGTLVVEAPEKSGALITANFALEQGRDVFAIPGPVFSPNASGVHQLIQTGAKLVHAARDIIEELNLSTHTAEASPVPTLTDETERNILALLEEPQTVDQLKIQTELPTAAIVSTLSLLELKGYIRPMGQNRFQKVL